MNKKKKVYLFIPNHNYKVFVLSPCGDICENYENVNYQITRKAILENHNVDIYDLTTGENFHYIDGRKF